MISPRNILLAIGLAGIALTLIWGGWNHIAHLNKMVGTLEAQNAQLQQQLAAMAEERDLCNRVLVGLEKELRQIQGDLSDKQDKLAKALLNSEENRAWAGTALPDDVAGLLSAKPGDKPGRADSTGQPTGGGTGAGVGGVH